MNTQIFGMKNASNDGKNKSREQPTNTRRRNVANSKKEYPKPVWPVRVKTRPDRPSNYAQGPFSRLSRYSRIGSFENAMMVSILVSFSMVSSLICWNDGGSYQCNLPLGFVTVDVETARHRRLPLIWVVLSFSAKSELPAPKFSRTYWFRFVHFLRGTNIASRHFIRVNIILPYKTCTSNTVTCCVSFLGSWTSIAALFVQWRDRHNYPSIFLVMTHNFSRVAENVSTIVRFVNLPRRASKPLFETPPHQACSWQKCSTVFSLWALDPMKHKKYHSSSFFAL